MELVFLSDILVFVGLMVLLGSVTKITLAWIDRRKGGPDAGTAALLEDIAQRLARLEQASDSTALEVERIAEGQRFATKLLAERNGAPVPAQPSAAERA